MADQAKPGAQAPARRPLSRDRILRAALELIDRDGFDALTMRRLADELDSRPMSLYRHVRDREDLIDGITELLGSEIHPPQTDDWHTYALESARAVHRIALAHPKPFAPLVARPRTAQAPHMAAAVSGLLERLVGAGLDEREALLATRTLVNFLIGAVLSDVVSRLDLSGPAVDPSEEFESGLQTVLRGIAAGIPR